MSGWIKWDWSHDKPYPEAEDTMVRVLLDWEEPQEQIHSKPDIVSKWDWGTGAGIVAYMPVVSGGNQEGIGK